MIPSKIWAGLAVLALIACKDKAPEPQMPNAAQVFPNLPLPPRASVVSRSGGPEALQLTLMSLAKAGDVEAYYRSVLSKSGWRLVNDMRDRDGSVALLAERDGSPLWVRIKRTDDSVATIVELAGAVLPDTTKRSKPTS
jgi:hypothetical protein